MIIIGVDFHPEFQQIASVDTETGEFQEKRLLHREEGEEFYRALAGRKVRVGMEASGQARWFERLLAELQFELWIGDAAEIRTKRVRKQKTDRQDAQLILRLLVEDRFRGSGLRVGRTGICGNCSGIAIEWCRHARAS
jgi:transposase